ncbi:MAG: DUF192 domain-containing protein [Acidimicrobiales bacterium]
MPWLLRDDKVLAALEVATARKDRMRGLLGRDGIDGALLLQPGKSVHSFGMRFPIDVAFCDRGMVVLRTVSLPPNRLTRVSIRCQCIIEAERGAFERWKLQAGDHLEVRE